MNPKKSFAYWKSFVSGAVDCRTAYINYEISQSSVYHSHHAEIVKNQILGLLNIWFPIDLGFVILIIWCCFMRISRFCHHRTRSLSHSSASPRTPPFHLVYSSSNYIYRLQFASLFVLSWIRHWGEASKLAPGTLHLLAGKHTSHNYSLNLYGPF